MKRVAAILWLVVGGVLACGALLNGLLMIVGLYDPVAHDGLAAKAYPWFAAAIVALPILFFVTAPAAIRMCGKSTFHEPRTPKS